MMFLWLLVIPAFAVGNVQASETNAGLLIGGSKSLFTGDLDLESGWGAQLGLSFFVPGRNELVLTFDYHKASVFERYCSWTQEMSYHRAVRQLIFLGNLKVNLANPHRQSVIPYLLFGAGFVDWKSSTDVQGIEWFHGGTDEGTDFAYTWGLGLEIQGRNGSGFLQVRSIEGEDSEPLDRNMFLLFTIGLVFPL